MATQKKDRLPKKPHPPSEDKFLVLLHASDRQQLLDLTRRIPMDGGEVKLNPDKKMLEAEFFITKSTIDKLKKAGWHPEVRENLSEIGRQRQKEVGKGDRFKGGAVPPKGLGKKL